MQVFFHDFFVCVDDLLLVIMYLSPFLITKPIDVLLQTNFKKFTICYILIIKKINEWHKIIFEKNKMFEIYSLAINFLALVSDFMFVSCLLSIMRMLMEYILIMNVCNLMTIM
jgi:hypothetical protein